MATKPSALPEWATDADRTIEPSAGEKGTGWQAGYPPAARKMNWLFNLIYTWFVWLDAHISNGVTAKDLTLWADDADPGTDQDGGDLTFSAGESTGDGGSTITFMAAPGGQGAGTTGRNTTAVGTFTDDGRFLTPYAVEANANAAGVPADTAGVTATGAATNGPGADLSGSGSGAGLEATGGSSNGNGVDATAGGSGDGVNATASTGDAMYGLSTSGHGVRGLSGSGIGVRGSSTTLIGVNGEGLGAGSVGVLASNSSTGRALEAQGNAAGAPFRILPQTAKPTGTSALGDMFVRSSNGHLYICTTAGTPGTYTSLVDGTTI